MVQIFKIHSADFNLYIQIKCMNIDTFYTIKMYSKLTDVVISLRALKNQLF